MNENTKSHVFAVDLDGSLLMTDVLWEQVGHLLRQGNLMILLQAILTLPNKPKFKRTLSESSELDVSKLPFNQQVVQLIANRKEAGQKIALVTATDKVFAEKVAAHLGLFDQVYGTTDDSNLKGTVKRDLLLEKYGEHGFAYLGDSNSDIPIWEKAEERFSVNASKSVRKRLDRIGPCHHLRSRKNLFVPLLRLLRPHQWVKNLLIFVPLIATLHFSLSSVAELILGCLVFCLAASSVYIFNDFLDLEADREHHSKNKRPMAAGDVPLNIALYIGIISLICALSIASSISAYFCLLVLFYFSLSSAYTYKLKKLAIFDLATLSILYTIRVISGAAIGNVDVSIWLMSFSAVFFFSLAAIKRLTELISMRERNLFRTPIRDYTVADIPVVSSIAYGTGVISSMILALYINSKKVAELYTTPDLLLLSNFILLIWINLLFIKTHRGEIADDPVTFALKDKFSWLGLAGITICFVMAI